MDSVDLWNWSFGKSNPWSPGQFSFAGWFSLLRPAPARNPIYPVLAPGQISLPINVPVTAPADLGKEFVITLKNWNQCNAYDNNLVDGNAFNPVSGNLVNGDNAPEITTARIVVVPAPQPDFLTRLGGAAGPLQTVFCVGDNIYFDNETPGIAGVSFANTWQFYDNVTGVMLSAGVRGLGEQIEAIEKRLKAARAEEPQVRRLMSIPGVGLIGAPAIAATVPDATLFRSGRTSPRGSVWCRASTRPAARRGWARSPRWATAPFAVC